MDGGEGLGLAETGLQGRSEQVVDEVRSGDVEAGEPLALQYRVWFRSPSGAVATASRSRASAKATRRSDDSVNGAVRGGGGFGCNSWTSHSGAGAMSISSGARPWAQRYWPSSLLEGGKTT